MASVSSQINAFDVQGLHQLSRQSLSQNAALKQAAEQFEAIFVRQLLGSMRKVNDLFKQDSIFDSQTTDFYQNMWDDQISSNLSGGSSGGISDLLVQQLGGVAAQHPLKPESVNTVRNIETKIDKKINFIQRTTIPGSANYQNEKINSAVSFDQTLSPETIDKLLPQTVEKVARPEPQKFSSPQDFIDFMKPLAIKASEVLGIKPQFIVAQSALETGWGKFIIQSKIHGNSRNLFNIKDKNDWHGKTAVKTSVEFDGVNLTQQQATFRVYDSFKQSLDDFMKFIQSDQRYQPLLENGQDSQAYLDHLQKSGYATDPEYASKISRILGSEIMQENFDEK